MIATLMRASATAEQTGDSEPVVKVVSTILADATIHEFPKFAATVKLERAYALAAAGKGLDTAGAQYVLAELDSIQDTLNSADVRNLSGLVTLVRACGLLTLGVNLLDTQALSRCVSLFSLGAPSYPSTGARALARLLAVRSHGLLLSARRIQSEPVDPDDYKELSTSVAALVSTSSAKDFLSSPRLVTAYHLTVALASLELSFGRKPASSGDPAGSAGLAGMDNINRSFVYSIGACNTFPAINPAPPLHWPIELATLLSSSVTAAAGLAAAGSKNAGTREELVVFLERLNGAYDEQQPESIWTIARGVEGFLASHSDLRQAIFGRGRALSKIETEVLLEALQTAATPHISDPAQGTLLLQGMGATLRYAMALP